EDALVSYLFSSNLPILVLVVLFEKVVKFDAARRLRLRVVDRSEEAVQFILGQLAIVIFVEDVEQREDLCELIARNFAVVVGVKQLRQAFAGSRATAHPAATHPRPHRVPLFLVDETILIGVDSIEHLHELLRELIPAEFLVFVLVELCESRELKVSHPAPWSAESARWWPRRLILRQSAA